MWDFNEMSKDKMQMHHLSCEGIFDLILCFLIDFRKFGEVVLETKDFGRPMRLVDSITSLVCRDESRLKFRSDEQAIYQFLYTI